MVFFRFIGQTCYFAEKSPMSSSFLAASTGLDHYIQGLIPFRWAAGGLEICWINFTSTPSPPKKTDRKHQLSLFCEGLCNITSILLGGCYTPFTKGFTFPNWLPNVISARFKQKLYDLHVTWILMERIDGSFSSGKKGKPGISISTLWLWLT